MVRNATRDRRTLRFYGEAHIVDHAQEREQIWGRVIQVERDTDPEKSGGYARGVDDAEIDSVRATMT